MRGTDFAEMAAFAAIATHRSFGKAAMHLGVSRPTLSQNLRSLEEKLGVRLLNRTTRSVALTEAGGRLLARLSPTLDELTAAIDEARESKNKPTGLLRIVVQPPVASFVIGPLLSRFFRDYPGIRLDVSVVKMPADIVSGGFDAGIRLGEQVERDMVTLRVTGEVRFVTVAAPAYLARHARPLTPRDLKNHDCIRNRLPNGAIFGWEYQKRGKSLIAAVAGSLTVDDIDLSIRAVLSGVGVAYLLYDYIAEDIAKGRLVMLLDDWSPRLSGFFLYHSSRRQISPPLRTFIDFLKAEAKASERVTSGVGSGTRTKPNYRLVPSSRR